MDLAVRHNSLVDELVFVLEPTSVPRALELPMNCSLVISNLGNFCSLDHVVDLSPW